MATTITSNDSDTNARHVRLRPKPGALTAGYNIYGNGIITPLRATNGMVWPYQPTVTYSQDVSYTAIDLVHTNQEMYAYTRTNAVKLTVDGQFSVQNQTEGVYAMACIHFLQTVSKMNFGQTDPNAGTPPPVLLFDAYGDFMFNQLPVIVTNFAVTLPNDVDYVPININYLNSPTSQSNQSINYQNTDTAALGKMYNFLSQSQTSGSIWLPALFNITVSITVQNTPSALRTAFNLDQFRSGALMQNTSGGTQGWI